MLFKKTLPNYLLKILKVGESVSKAHKKIGNKVEIKFTWNNAMTSILLQSRRPNGKGHDSTRMNPKCPGTKD